MEEILYPAPKQQYKVLVKTITYNQAKYIQDTLNGVAMQQTNFPFVEVVIDDCSTDGEQDIIKSWLTENCVMENAEYIEIPTSHMIMARHKTNSNCTFVIYLLKRNLWKEPEEKRKHFKPWEERCDYIAMCEGDDYWIDPLKLQKQVDFLNNNPEYILCGTNGIVIYEEGTNRPWLFSDLFRSRELNSFEIIKKWSFPTASLFFRKEVYHNYPEWTKQIYSGDLTLILISMSKGKIYGMKDLSCIYRINEVCKDSISQKTSFKKVYTHHKLLYENFNEFTNGKYKEEITIKINKLNKELEKINKEEEFCERSKISRLHAFIWDPVYSIAAWSKYLISKIKPKHNSKNVISYNR